MEETMRIFIGLVVLAVVLVSPVTVSWARAKAYRCVLDDGHVSYQQIPCHYGSKPMKLKDRRSGWSSLRPGERALLNSYRQKDAARREVSPGRRKIPDEQTRSCWTKRTQLAAVRAKLRRGYKLKESDELRRKRENYQDYLRKFCS
jgi:hypothetical protein